MPWVLALALGKSIAKESYANRSRACGLPRGGPLHPSHALPEVVLSTSIALTSSHKLKKKCARDLYHARDDFFYF